MNTKPQTKDKPKQLTRIPRPKPTANQVKQALRAGRWDDAYDLSHRKAG